MTVETFRITSTASRCPTRATETISSTGFIDFLLRIFFSVDVGPIHWQGVSTEYYGFYYIYGWQTVLTQYDWLKQDLEVQISLLDAFADSKREQKERPVGDQLHASPLLLLQRQHQ